MALSSFGTRGYEASSLDAIAAELGVRKQTILYYFPTKEALLDAVIDRSASELSTALEDALVRAGRGLGAVEAVVRSVFRLALRRPELLGLLREVSRLGPPPATRLTEALDPLVQRARLFLEAEMDNGTMRRQDARLVLLSAYSAVIGVATEVEVLARRRHRSDLAFARDASPRAARLPAIGLDGRCGVTTALIRDAKETVKTNAVGTRNPRHTSGKRRVRRFTPTSGSRLGRRECDCGSTD